MTPPRVLCYPTCLRYVLWDVWYSATIAAYAMCYGVCGTEIPYLPTPLICSMSTELLYGATHALRDVAY
eukprot:1759434-Rhodomonas_salina.1